MSKERRGLCGLMAELKLTWNEFVKAALASLSFKHKISQLAWDYERGAALREEDHVRFVKDHTYEGENECYEIPEYVYVKLED